MFKVSFLFTYLFIFTFQNFYTNFLRDVKIISREKEISENFEENEERNFEERLMKRVDPDRNNRRIFELRGS